MIILRWKFADTDISKNAVHKRHCSHHRRLNLTILTNTAVAFLINSLTVIQQLYTSTKLTMINQKPTFSEQCYKCMYVSYMCWHINHPVTAFFSFHLQPTYLIYSLFSDWLSKFIYTQSNMLSPPPPPRFFLGCCLKRSLQVIGWARIHLQSCYFSNE